MRTINLSTPPLAFGKANLVKYGWIVRVGPRLRSNQCRLSAWIPRQSPADSIQNTELAFGKRACGNGSRCRTRRSQYRNHAEGLHERVNVGDEWTPTAFSSPKNGECAARRWRSTRSTC